ncbi:DUF4214 domain-containing protein [Opitutus sp. ER46]|uniref:DUF4214 domain-containing protein n=1 Tax=Opitutus sp. ER46 TaxID=2161864 RepID=UPI000D31DE33|nr:DUF4214 domain-containing protein [Opitutus sp. ER46]PTX90723.1 hypothetical protein DB354_18855 [Opitutus sp. ER46]
MSLPGSLRPALVLLATLAWVTAFGQPRPPEPPPLEAAVVVEVYTDILGRAPHAWEVTYCPAHTRNDLRSLLLQSFEYRALSPEVVIHRAFFEYCGRGPTPEEMRHYRRRMIDERWSVGRIRQDINRQWSNDDEHHGRGPGYDNDGPRGRRDAIDRMIERAYDDLLERRPDREGMEHYRRFLERGGSESSMRARLRESEEYRVKLPDSKTTRAYQNVLRRAPDAGGMEHYRKLLVDRGWSQRDVEADLRRSDEYRNRKR